MSKKPLLKSIKPGPAILVTAAFIGPGTVITASLAGANFGFVLIWALLFSVVATMVLQEMAARLGVVTQQGLGENLRASIKNPMLRWFLLGLVFCAIVIGNGAYQSGNISGASLGLSSLFSNSQLSADKHFNFWPIIIGVLAFSLMWRGSYQLIEKTLIGLVLLMSLAFIITFVMTNPSIGDLLKGLLVPRIPSGAALTVVGLIGTTVVPYNLFLHAASASQKWKSPEQLPQARRDIFISIPLGGLISIAIVSTAASAFFGKQVSISSAADLAPALAPLFGQSAKFFMAVGLFAAGISSAITAPLASAFALSGILNIKPELGSIRFKAIWISILLIGMLVSSFGYKPINIIWFAQVANGILLPVVSLFLLWTMNRTNLGQYRNTMIQNLLGAIIILVTLMLSGRSLMSAFGFL